MSICLWIIKRSGAITFPCYSCPDSVESQTLDMKLMWPRLVSAGCFPSSLGLCWCLGNCLGVCVLGNWRFSGRRGFVWLGLLCWLSILLLQWLRGSKWVHTCEQCCWVSFSSHHASFRACQSCFRYAVSKGENAVHKLWEKEWVGIQSLVPISCAYAFLL